MLKEVGTREEFVIVISFESVLPMSRDLKSTLSWLRVMKGYLPIALTLSVRVSSWPLVMSVNLITKRVTSTFASSVLKVRVISCFLFG